MAHEARWATTQDRLSAQCHVWEVCSFLLQREWAPLLERAPFLPFPALMEGFLQEAVQFRSYRHHPKPASQVWWGEGAPTPQKRHGICSGS